MSAVGNAGSAVPGDQAPGVWESFGGGLRLLVGWASVAVAVLNLVVELEHVPDRAYLIFHAVLLVGGLLLISLGRGAAGSGPAGLSAGGAVLTGGMLFSALPSGGAACCMTEYAVRHGYPFTFLARDDGGPWDLDSWHLIADLLFWGYAGLIVLVLVAVTRRVTRHHGEARE